MSEEQDWDLFHQPEPKPRPLRSPFALPTESDTEFSGELDVADCFEVMESVDNLISEAKEVGSRALAIKIDAELTALARKEPEQVIALSADETTLEIKAEPVPKTAPEPAQVALFEKGEWWEESWKGMPAFAQKDMAPWKSIYVHFENRADMESFSRLTGQSVTLNTRSIWWPEAEIGRRADKRFVDEPGDDAIEVLDEQ